MKRLPARLNRPGDSARRPCHGGQGGGAREILVLVSGHKQGKFQDVSGVLLRSP